jgi:hypothetical protein
MVTPGASGPPDSGTILVILPPLITVSGTPLATAGSICLMINSVWGFPYPLVIGPLASTGANVGGQALVRVGDNILSPSPPRVLTILGRRRPRRLSPMTRRPREEGAMVVD